MAFSVMQLPNEPVVIGMLELPVDDHLDDIPLLLAEIARLIVQVGGRLTAIWDFRGQEIAFSDILLLLDAHRGHPPGSLTDPRVRTLVVGDHPLLPVAISHVRKTLGVELRRFDTLAEALAVARAGPNASG